MHIGDSLVPTTSDWRFLPTICARDYTCISTKLFGCCAVKNLPAFARCLIHSPTPRQFPDIFQPDYRLWTHALRSSRGTPGLLIFVLSLLFQRDHRLWPSTDGFLHSANRRFDLNGANSFPAGMVFFRCPIHPSIPGTPSPDCKTGWVFGVRRRDRFGPPDALWHDSTCAAMTAHRHGSGTSHAFRRKIRFLQERTGCSLPDKNGAADRRDFGCTSLESSF